MAETTEVTATRTQIEQGVHFTRDDLRALAVDKSMRREAVVRLDVGCSAERLDSGKGARLWGPGVLVTRFWQDGGEDQSLRPLDQLPAPVRERQPDSWTLARRAARRKAMGGPPPSATAWGETKPLPEWSDDVRCRVDLATLRERLAAGWEAERALSQDTEHVLEAFGESKTFAQWVQDPRCRVAATALRSRLVRGWTLERALDEPVRHQPSTSLTAWGETRSLTDWIDDERCAANRQAVYARLRLGWDAERALSTPVRGSKGQEG